MYVDNKFPHWRPDFRGSGSIYALEANARRVGMLEVVQFTHFADGGRALSFGSGKGHVYDRGSFRPCDRMQSDEIIAICQEYAPDAEGLALLIYRDTTSPENGDAPYVESNIA